MRMGQKLWIFYYWSIFELVRFFLTQTLYLFSYREDALPTENDSSNCEALCQSTSSGQVDSCGGLSTHSDTFFVLVNAHAEYTNGVLSFTGDNLQNIENMQSND